MHVLASVAVSVDGFVDDDTPARLILSSPEDLREVYRLRANQDAVLVGANTIRRDDPSLVTTHEDDVAFRRARGLAPDPIKVTRTRTGDLAAGARFFVRGAGAKLVFAAPSAVAALEARLGGAAEVIAGDASPKAIVAALHARGARRLMIEGGPETLRSFLAADLVDELRVATAPRLIGARGAARFTGASDRRLTFARRELFGDTAVTWYTLDRGGAS